MYLWYDGKVAIHMYLYKYICIFQQNTWVQFFRKLENLWIFYKYICILPQIHAFFACIHAFFACILEKYICIATYICITLTEHHPLGVREPLSSHFYDEKFTFFSVRGQGFAQNFQNLVRGFPENFKFWGKPLTKL